jgi:hypothetical protein
MRELKVFREWIDGLIAYTQEVDEDGLYQIDRLETYTDYEVEGFTCQESLQDFIQWIETYANDWEADDFRAIDNLVKLWHLIYKKVKVLNDGEVEIIFRKKYEQL